MNELLENLLSCDSWCRDEAIKIMFESLLSISEASKEHMPECIKDVCTDGFYKTGDEYIALSAYSRQSARYALSRLVRMVDLHG